MPQTEKRPEKEEKKWIRIAETKGIGKVGISEDVLAIMAGISAMEVDGVASINKNATRQLIAKIGIRSLAHGVRVVEEDGAINVSINLNLEYEYNAAKVSAQVQEKVKTCVQNMTGLTVQAVNVSIAGVALPTDKKKS